MTNDQTIKQMQELIGKINQSSSAKVPGLNKDVVIEQIMKKNKQFDAALKSAENSRKNGIYGPTPEELKDNFKKSYEPMVDEQIAIINSSYSTVKDGVAQLGQNVTAAISTTIIPPAIGTPPVVSNPAYTLVENKQKVNTFKAIVTQLMNTFLQLLSAALKIGFALPAAVLKLFDAITSTKKLIDTIPVP